MGKDLYGRLIHKGKGETQLMLNRIKEILNGVEALSAWIITESRLESSELFFIKEELDLNRATSVHEFGLKIFVDFEEGGVKYRGDASLLISPTDSDEEIRAKLDRAIFSAGFVRNKYYDLPEKEEDYLEIEAGKPREDLREQYKVLSDIFFKDYGYEAGLNSLELFAVQGEKRLVSSKGVDVTYPYSEFSFEIVTDSDKGEEAVEIFRDYTIKTLDLDLIERLYKSQLMETEGRMRAVTSPKLENIRLIISGPAVEEFFQQFYLEQALDSAIYRGISKVKPGEQFLKEGASEALTIRMRPELKTSPHARPVDEEGKKLSDYALFKEGRCENIRSSSRYAHYLGIENRGLCECFEVEPGLRSIEEYRQGDYLEVLTFSSFLMDSVTGDFGGEFRLAKLVQNGKESYVSGGAVSENVFKIQDKMLFSKERELRSYSITPTSIIIDGVTVAAG